MHVRLRLFFLLLLPALALAACGDGDEADVDIAAAPSNIDEPDLLGYWTVLEINGEIPAGSPEIRYQFTAEGDFVRYEGTEVERSRYTFAGPSQLTVDGPAGTTFYEYALDDGELTLEQPGESITLQKIADVDLDDVPAPSNSVPEEDSLPPDSM